MTQLLDLVRRHGVELKKVASTKGGEYQGPCPACGGNDRFHVWPEQNNGEGSYWCRQCGKGGDRIQFLRDFEGLTFHQACERLGRTVPDSRSWAAPAAAGKKTWEATHHESPEDLWREKALKFCTWSYEQLFERQEALEWLKARGIREATTGRYGLGWNTGKDGKDLYRAREAWGLSQVKNERGRARPLWLPIGMVIPYIIEREVQRLRIRRPGEVIFGPKYYVVPGSSMGTMMLEQGQKVHVIIESELDAILVAQEAGDLAGAIALGSASAKPDETATRILRDSLQILVALDFDGAGAKYWPWWKKHFPDCQRWPVPKGKDPGEAYQAGVDLREWVKAGLPPGLQ